MTNYLLSISIVSLLAVLPWGTHFDEAKTEATASGKLILLNFSGSDWCAPCKRMKNEIFAADTFNNYAETHLVLVSADFPRAKKRALSKEQALENEALAERFNPKGLFPVTLLIDSTGQVLRTWQGMPSGGADWFVADLKTIRP
jgi:thioredoxin-related protein